MKHKITKQCHIPCTELYIFLRFVSNSSAKIDWKIKFDTKNPWTNYQR